MQKIALIQLVSEQTMQNVVPVLALQPERLVHLTTAKTAPRSENVKAAALETGLAPDLENIRLSNMPTIAETARHVARAIEGVCEIGLTPVVNFTGGTKLMSIGAYQAAQNAGAMSFYVDTDAECFMDGGTGGCGIAALLGGDVGFSRLRNTLTVDAIAAANGRRSVSTGRDWQRYLRLAEKIFECPEREAALWNGVHGPRGLCPNGQEPRDPLGWLQLLDKSVQIPAELADLAVEAELLVRSNGCLYLPQESRPLLAALVPEGKKDERYYQAVSPLQASLGFLAGGWWEVVVMAAAERSGRFDDLRWSVNVASQPGAYSLEEDIVGVDGIQIAYFSCKRGGGQRKQRLVPLLDELDNRARSIGGRFTKRFLCVYLPLDSKARGNLRRRSQELNGIRIVTPDDLRNGTAF